ncbi:MAG: AgmX/PglI C-terminal domain-containing protein [Myxococcota bacterium]
MQDHRYVTDPSSTSTRERVAEAIPAATTAQWFAPPRSRIAAGPKGYRMIPAPGAASPTDCDTQVDGVTVHVRWGDTTLAVHHLDEGQNFVVGETETDDLQIPSSLLGQPRLALVRDRCVVLPERATGLVRRAANVETSVEMGVEMSLDEVIASGATRPCPEAPRAAMLPLRPGMSVTIVLGDLIVEVRGEKKGRRLRAFTLAALASGAAASIAGSFLAHAGLLGAMAMMMPDLGHEPDDALTENQRYFVQQALDSEAEREHDEPDLPAVDEGAEQAGASGQRHAGDEGAAGDEAAPRRDGRIAIQDRDPDKAVGQTRAELMEDAGTFGLINVLRGSPGPESDLGVAFASGLDAIDANGTMWAGDPADGFGPGGLGLTGIGEGGGDRGTAYGLGPIGTIGHGSCGGTVCGANSGFGRGFGRLQRGREARPPRMRSEGETLTGQLPPEVIQRIVRNNYGRFRGCYEGALRHNPNLAGRVVVSFVIGRSGTVNSVSGGGDLPDTGVISCVASHFRGLTFPPPERGIVTVSYPIVFTPGA